MAFGMQVQGCAPSFGQETANREGYGITMKIPMQNRDKNPSFVQALELGVWTAPNIPTPVISENDMKVIGLLAHLCFLIPFVSLMSIRVPTMGKGVDTSKAGMLSTLPLAVS